MTGNIFHLLRLLCHLGQGVLFSEQAVRLITQKPPVSAIINRVVIPAECACVFVVQRDML